MTDSGKHNAKIGDVHDFSKKKHSVVYVLPRKRGRYFYFESQLPESLSIWEIEIYEETQRKFVAFDPYNKKKNNDRSTVPFLRNFHWGGGAKQEKEAERKI